MTLDNNSRNETKKDDYKYSHYKNMTPCFSPTLNTATVVNTTLNDEGMDSFSKN
jgi:hypothetical protein